MGEGWKSETTKGRYEKSFLIHNVPQFKVPIYKVST